MLCGAFNILRTEAEIVGKLPVHIGGRDGLDHRGCSLRSNLHEIFQRRRQGLRHKGKLFGALIGSTPGSGQFSNLLLGNQLLRGETLCGTAFVLTGLHCQALMFLLFRGDPGNIGIFCGQAGRFLHRPTRRSFCLALGQCVLGALNHPRTMRAHLARQDTDLIGHRKHVGNIGLTRGTQRSHSLKLCGHLLRRGFCSSPERLQAGQTSLHAVLRVVAPLRTTLRVFHFAHIKFRRFRTHLSTRGHRSFGGRCHLGCFHFRNKYSLNLCGDLSLHIAGGF